MLSSTIRFLAITGTAYCQLSASATATNVASLAPNNPLTTFSNSISNAAGGLTATTAQNISDSGITTIAGFYSPVASVYASIVAAAPCATTMVVNCLNPLCLQLEGVQVVYIQGPYSNQYSLSTSANTFAISGYQSCSFQGPSSDPTQAICSATVSLSDAVGIATTSGIVTYPAASLHGYITVTAGEDLLATATGSCTSKSMAVAGRVAATYAGSLGARIAAVTVLLASNILL